MPFTSSSCRPAHRLLLGLTVLCFWLAVAQTRPTAASLSSAGDGGGSGAVGLTSAGDAVLHVVQQATADAATRSISFLASGYQSESAFLADVGACVAALTNSTGGVSSDPWPRYLPLFNIYAVYERSPDAGASRVVGPLHSCRWMANCTARAVNNNLGCAFGTPNPHILSCDLQRVRAMAARAPALDVAVVLVNDAEPGGVGGDGVAYITNEPAFMAPMLVHYLNRAFARLQEEYSLGVTATSGRTTLTAPNCAAAASAEARQWDYWRYGASAAEGRGCTVEQFVAPTQSGCLMQSSSISTMCPICREQLTLSFFNASVAPTLLLGGEVARPALDLTAGRCPPPGHTFYTAPPSTASSSSSSLSSGQQRGSRRLYLSLGPFAFQNDLEVTWAAADGTVLARDVQSLYVEDIAGWTLPTTVTATITDASPDVRPAWRQDQRAAMTSTTVFSIDVWTEGVDCTVSAAVPPCFAQRATFASLAQVPAGICAPPAHAVGEDVPGTPAHQSAALSATVLRGGVGYDYSSAALLPTMRQLPVVDMHAVDPGVSRTPVLVSAPVCGGLTLVALAVCVSVFYCRVRPYPREVLHMHALDVTVYTGVCVLAAVSAVLGALAVTVVCAFVPSEYFAGSPVALATLVMGAVQCAAASANLAAVLYRWSVCLLVCGMLSAVLGAGLLATGLMALFFYVDPGTQAHADRMALLWQRLLASASGSDYLCYTVQASLKCSGFHAGCFMTTSAECPAECANNAFYTNACEVPFTYYMARQHLPVAVVALVCGVVCVGLGAGDLAHFALLQQLRHSGRLRRYFRIHPKPPMEPITAAEAAEARRGFSHVCDVSPMKTMSGARAASFLETVFAKSLTEDYARELERRGPFTYEELMALHFPFSTVVPTPTPVSHAADKSAAADEPPSPAATPVTTTVAASVAAAAAAAAAQPIHRGGHETEEAKESAAATEA